MDFEGFSIRGLLDHCLATDNEAAWNEFFKRITPTVFGVVHKRVNRWGRHGPDLVQDLFQEALLKLVEKNKAALRSFEWFHEDSIYSYVKVVASRVVADHFRKGENEVSLEDIPDTISSTTVSEREILQSLQWDEVERCLQSINTTPEEKAIFCFYYRSGFTAKEIGGLAGINLKEKDVETILARLKRQVRRKMSGDSKFVKELPWPRIERSLDEFKTSPEEKQIFRLWHCNSCSANEISRGLGHLSQEQIEAILTRLMRQLRGSLG